MTAMLLLAAGCYLLRITFVTLLPAGRLPKPVTDALGHLAPAVLAALVIVDLAGAAHGPARQTLPALAAVALIAIVTWLTRNLALAVGLGLAAALVIDLLPL